MKSLQKNLNELKKQKWNEAIVSFYIVKRRLIKRVAEYDVLLVNITEELQNKLKKIAVRRIEKSNQVREYDFSTSDLDDDVLSLNRGETDMEHILGRISGNNNLKTVSDFSEFNDSWMYITRMDIPDISPLFTARRISSSWNTEKRKKLIDQLTYTIFKNNMLVDLGQQVVFGIDSKVDFFAFENYIFIADKKNFETALNFRVGMERNRDEIIEELRKMPIFQDVDDVSRLVGDNLRYLRKLSQVKKAGYYKDPNYLGMLKKVSDAEKWGIKYSEDGRILVTAEDIGTVLRVLNNDRLTSKINSENFDVDVKHKV